MGTLGTLIYLALIVVVIAGMWKMYEKADEPGWAAIVPIYNVWVLLRIVGRPGWWLLLMLIPIVNFVVAIIVALDLARSFGRGGGFAVGLIFLGFVFYPILGFGEDEYIGPGGAPAGMPPAVA